MAPPATVLTGAGFAFHFNEFFIPRFTITELQKVLILLVTTGQMAGVFDRTPIIFGAPGDFADIGSDSESRDSDSDGARTDAGSSSSGEESRPSAHRYLHRGVLDPASDSDDEEVDGDAGAAFTQEYAAALREQLREAAPAAAPPGEAEDVDLEVVQGLLDSVAAQEGLPGPGSNLLGLLGVRLPADPPAAPDRTGP